MNFSPCGKWKLFPKLIIKPYTIFEKYDELVFTESHVFLMGHQLRLQVTAHQMGVSTFPTAMT